MHEKSPTLAAQTRDKIGSRYCERLRKVGRLPAVLYGHGQDPVSISLDMREALSHITKGEKVFRLDFPGSKNKDEMQIVLLKDLQFDYLGNGIVHADFARVDLNERIRTRVPVHCTGEAIGLKTAGAILMHPTTEVEIECLVLELPDFIELNVAGLEVEQGITAGQLKLPSANMKLITDTHAMLAQIIIQQEIVVAEATAAAPGTAEPEVLTAKKPAEGEAAAGKDGKPAPAAKGAAPAAKGAAPAAKPAGGAAKK
jgi:large subunit ribosomal protein L25